MRLLARCANMTDSETETVEFEIQVRGSDLRQALLAWQLRKPWTWLLVGIGSLMLLGSLAEYLQGHAIPAPWLTVGSVWVLLPFFLPFIQVRKTNLGPEGLATAQYKIDSRGIKRATAGTSVELAWNILYGIHETSRAFLVLTNKNCFFVIPKQLLDGDALVRTANLLSHNLRRR